MFKIGKLDKLENEEIRIDTVSINRYDMTRKKQESFDTIEFNIKGSIQKDEYHFSFCLNCKPEKLLEITDEKRVDFKDYILQGETYLTINGITDIDPVINIYIIRCYRDRFAININFYTRPSIDDTYSGQIELDLNLDECMEKINKKEAREIVGYEG